MIDATARTHDMLHTLCRQSPGVQRFGGGQARAIKRRRGPQIFELKVDRIFLDEDSVKTNLKKTGPRGPRRSARGGIASAHGLASLPIRPRRGDGAVTAPLNPARPKKSIECDEIRVITKKQLPGGDVGTNAGQFRPHRRGAGV